MILRLASLLFRCYNDICSVWSSGQCSSRWLACIYMWGIHLLRTCTPLHSTPTLCGSVSHFLSHSYMCIFCLLAVIEKYITVRSRCFPSICAWDQSGDGTDLVSKPTFVLEPESGSSDQMRKQCSHWGGKLQRQLLSLIVQTRPSRVSLLTVSVTSALHCTNCRWDFCASGAVIKLHISAVTGFCLRICAVKSSLCTSGISDDPSCYCSPLTCCVLGQCGYDYTLVAFWLCMKPSVQ